LWADPCPTVAIEAMAAGTPVVASNAGGLPHLIRDGIDGVLVPPGDVAALRTAITDLLLDDGRRSAMAAQAQRRAANFTASAIVPRIERAYEAAIAARAAA
jgi:glycogen synthase